MIALTACGSRAKDSAPPGPGSISVRWSGKLNGTFTAPANARWCASDTLLEITAVRNDTAVGLALIAQDSIRAVTYPVNDSKVYIAGRPQANVALRWMAEFDLKGYDAWSGQVTVTSGGSRTVSGTFDVQLRPLYAADSLKMTGTFDRLTLSPSAPPCGRANRPATG
jgi:hypothetical protein